MQTPSVLASELADFVGGRLVGEDVRLVGVSAAASPAPATLTFIKRDDPALAEAVNAVPTVVVLISSDSSLKLAGTRIVTAGPRLSFARAVRRYFWLEDAPGIATTAVIAPTASLATDVAIGDYSVLGNNVRIGKGTRVGSHVTIAAGTQIGEYCRIKSHAAIGEQGFAYEVDSGGEPVLIPHLGTVRIGNYVDVGSFTTVVRGTIGETILSDHAKIDDHVHIAHNVEVGEASFVIANAEVSGSVTIGPGAWIAPQASILNGVTIGAGAMVGLGAVVTKRVSEREVVVGNPARVIRVKGSDALTGIDDEGD